MVRDAGGHYWTGQAWSDDPAGARLYLRESEAMRAGLRCHEAEHAQATFKACVLVSVGKGEWTLEELAGYLSRWGRFVLVKTAETRKITVTIRWDGLTEDDHPAE
jgi:tellurite resistance protein